MFHWYRSNTIDYTCSRCGVSLVLVGESLSEVIKHSANPENSGSSCPVCATNIEPGDELHICSLCETPHHKDCWEYLNGCAIFGCQKVSGVNELGANNSKTSPAPINMGMIHFWKGFFKFHWLMLRLLLNSLMWISGFSWIYQLHSSVFGLLTTETLGLGGVLFPFGALFYCLFFVSMFLYVLLQPLSLLFELYFRSINANVVPEHSKFLSSVADRIDMPNYVKNVKSECDSHEVTGNSMVALTIPFWLYVSFFEWGQH